MKAARKKAVEQYGIGSTAGHTRAQAWLADPKRGNPDAGGTLSMHVLELADLMAGAVDDDSAARVRGEIVGFCYAIECPAHAAACQAADRRRDAVATARGAA